MSERFSALMIRIMLGIYAALMILGVLLGTLGKWQNFSYLAALICAVCLLLAAKRWLPLLQVRLSARSQPRPRPLVAGLILTLLCAALHLAWIFCFQIEPTMDFFTFYEAAQQVARGETVNWLYLGLFPHILGYSSFLGYFMQLLGDFPLLAPLLNVVLTCISGLAIYLLCLRWAGYRPAIVAYVLWILCPSKLIYNSMVISEPLYTCLILIFLLLLSFVCDSRCSLLPRTLAAVPLSLVCGAFLQGVNAVRPVALILLIAYFIWLFLLRGHKLREFSSWALMALFTAGLLLSYSYCGEKWDNWLRFKLYEEPAKLPAYNIYVGLNPESEGSFSEADMDLLMSYRYDQERGSAVYAQEKMLEEVQTRINSGKINFPRLFAVKLGKLIGNDEGGAFYAKDNLNRLEYLLCSFISNVYYYVLVLLSLSGAVALYKKPVYSSVYLPVLYSIGLILAHLIVEVSGRYKYSILPMLVILSAMAYGQNSPAEKVSRSLY